MARIVADEIGLGAKGVAAALLHDVVEDTDYSLEDIEGIFGKKVADIVDGLTKLEGVFDQTQSKQAENFRKLLLTMVEDIRVILIKLADRLHNMRTLDSMPEHKRLKIAGETLYMYAPWPTVWDFTPLNQNWKIWLSNMNTLKYLKKYQPNWKITKTKPST